MNTIYEISHYYQELESAFASSNPIYKYNQDRSHNSVVMRFILDKSDSISMYCGRMSVFRKSFYDHFSDNEEAKKFLITKMELSLKEFFSKDNSHLNVIFENYKPDYIDDLICKDVFLDGIKSKKVNLYKMDDKFSFKKSLNHFTLSDKGMARVEQDKLQHSAICSFHNTVFHEALSNIFNKLLELAKPVSC